MRVLCTMYHVQRHGSIEIGDFAKKKIESRDKIQEQFVVVRWQYIRRLIFKSLVLILLKPT